CSIGTVGVNVEEIIESLSSSVHWSSSSKSSDVPLNSGDSRGPLGLAALKTAKPFDGLITLSFSARAKAEIASLLERRAALATFGFEPGELARVRVRG
ncbi:hypothetical protein H8356DRAFT_971430, partial [Neocallimastix lanati (nom. inval.)]